MLQDFTYKQTQPRFLCQKHVRRESALPDLNYFCQAKNYQFLVKPRLSSYGLSRFSDVSRKQLIKAAWYLLYLLIHHFMRFLCPPFTSSALVLAFPHSLLPVLLMFFIFLPLPVPFELLFLLAYLVSSLK